jgi:hypothetical protein
MPTTLRWIVSSSASAFHAAEAIARQTPLADDALADALMEPAARLAVLVSASGIPGETFWSHVTALAAGIHNNRELADVALDKTIGRGPRQAALIDELTRAFTALEKAFDSILPRCLDDLELRSGPLREQWEARGPGLLSEVAHLTEPSLIAEQADVLLVHPALGGAGSAHLPYNSVRIEAVLANPHHTLPEIVRLAWLLAQLNLDLPLYEGALSRQRMAEMGALAMIPPVLCAAETVELARYDAATLQLALAAWRLSAENHSQAAQTLVEWWTVYGGSHPAWPVALAALDRMLA